MVDRKILNYNLLILGGIFINVLNTLTSLIMLIWFLNQIFIKKLNQEELLKYKSILKDSLLIVFLYLSIVFAIHIDKSQIFVSPWYMAISLIVGLILPMIVFKATNIKKVSQGFSNSFPVIKKCIEFAIFSLGIVIILSIVLNNNFLNYYSDLIMILIIFLIVLDVRVGKFKI